MKRQYQNIEEVFEEITSAGGIQSPKGREVVDRCWRTCYDQSWASEDGWELFGYVIEKAVKLSRHQRMSDELKRWLTEKLCQEQDEKVMKWINSGAQKNNSMALEKWLTRIKEGRLLLIKNILYENDAIKKFNMNHWCDIVVDVMQYIPVIPFASSTQELKKIKKSIWLENLKNLLLSVEVESYQKKFNVSVLFDSSKVAQAFINFIHQENPKWINALKFDSIFFQEQKNRLRAQEECALLKEGLDASQKNKRPPNKNDQEEVEFIKKPKIKRI